MINLSLWYKVDIFIVLFVNDCGITAKLDSLIDELIRNPTSKNFKLTNKEETFNEF